MGAGRRTRRRTAARAGARARRPTRRRRRAPAAGRATRRATPVTRAAPTRPPPTADDGCECATPGCCATTGGCAVTHKNCIASGSATCGTGSDKIGQSYWDSANYCAAVGTPGTDSTYTAAMAAAASAAAPQPSASECLESAVRRRGVLRRHQHERLVLRRPHRAGRPLLRVDVHLERQREGRDLLRLRALERCRVRLPDVDRSHLGLTRGLIDRPQGPRRAPTRSARTCARRGRPAARVLPVRG